MKAHELAKQHGLKSLTQVSELTGQSNQTLINWHKNKPQLFEIVLLGCNQKQVQLVFENPITTTLILSSQNKEKLREFALNIINQQRGGGGISPDTERVSGGSGKTL